MKGNAWWSVAYRLRDYIRPERKLVILSVLALLISTLTRLLKPLPLAFVMDYVLFDVSNKKHHGVKFDLGTMDKILDKANNDVILAACAVAVVIIALVMAGSSYFSTVGLASAGSRILSRVRNDLFEHLLRLSLRFHSRAKTGDLTMRLISDIGMLREVVITALLPMMANIFIILGMFGVMLYMNWQLTAITMLVLPLIWFSSTRSGKKIHQVSREQRKREGSLASKATEYIVSIRTVQALSLENTTYRSFAGDDKITRNQNVKAKRLSSGLERRIDIIVAIITAIVLLKGSYTVLAGRMTPGDLMVFMSYLNNAFRPVREYAKYTGRLSKALAAGERVIKLLDEEPDIKDSADAVPLEKTNGQIRFDRVYFGYSDDKNHPSVLRGMDFTIEAGESVAIIGPSGAGKSTITNLLLRLYDVDQGAVKIDGHDIREYTIASLRAQIAIVPQDNLLFGLTVRENIALGAVNKAEEITDEEIIAAAKLAQAHDFISALPQGYDTVLSERGSSLSGGQRQRIAIARAAMNRGSILILDEPTVGLDQENETYVVQALQNLMRNRTTIMITHDLTLAAKTDRIIFVDQGRVCEQGNHQELLDKGGAYADWWNMQLN